MEKIKEMLKDTKVQCSGATKETIELYAKLGITIPEADFIYIDENLNAEAVSPKVFKLIRCKEIGPGSLKALIERAEKESVVYEPGTFIVAEKNGKKAVAVVLSDEGGHVVTISQDWEGVLCKECLGYTKPVIRRANAAEMSKLAKQLREAGKRVEFLNGLLDLFYFRPKGQKYWHIDPDFTEGFVAVEDTEDHDKFDTYLFNKGNYFKTKDAAIAALMKLVE